MGQVLIRDLDEKTLQTLKRRAERNRRSLQRELHLILTEAAVLPAETTAAARKPVAAARVKPARRGSVWEWLRKRPREGLTKVEIDRRLQAERESWDA